MISGRSMVQAANTHHARTAIVVVLTRTRSNKQQQAQETKQASERAAGARVVMLAHSTRQWSYTVLGSASTQYQAVVRRIQY